ncbi:hypothetical protein ACSSWA_00465 [Melioribacter sp. Ez-97]|uniref:hypothetical protein n=1 Tax=Melioribacter sp. Ez-97 TaxID=3423434 RepID=UPI003EDB56B6
MSEAVEKHIVTTGNKGASVSEFFKLGRELFELSFKGEFDYIKHLKDNIKILSFDIPEELKEIFIPFNNAPIYWVYDSWLLAQIEEYMKANFNRAKYFDLHKSIKENYAKWATAQIRGEKEYYANLTMSFIERDIYKHNFFKFVIQAILHTYHNSIYNFSKADGLFNEVKQMVVALKLQEPVLHELLYIVNLFHGFLYLKEKRYDEANNLFKEAVETKQNGITAKIYSALCELKLNNREIVEYYIREVITYDFHRMIAAIDVNNFGMFNYFLINALIYNVFYEKDFAPAQQLIADTLSPYRLTEENTLKKIADKIILLKELKVDEYITEDINKHFVLLDKVIKAYAESANTLVIGMYPEFERKYQETLDLIVEEKKKREYQEIEQSLVKYDEAINDYSETIKRLKKELETFHEKVKSNLDDVIKTINSNYEYEKQIIEDKILQLPHLERYNPAKSFSANMVNNTIIALIVFLIGGLAGYSNESLAYTSGYNSTIMMIIFSGLRWGIVSFLIGVLISGVIAGFVLIDRVDEKQKLVKKLNSLKFQKDRLIKEAEEYSKDKETVMRNSITASIDHHKRQIDELQEEREKHRKRITEQVEEKVKQFTETLDTVR